MHINLLYNYFMLPWLSEKIIKFTKRKMSKDEENK